MTKSVLSILVGIAVGRGELACPDRTVGSLLGDRLALTPAQAAITWATS